MEKNNIPFSIVETKQLDCHFGPHYYQECKPKSHRVFLQGTRKIGCNARIIIKKCKLFPEFEALPTIVNFLTHHKSHDHSTLLAATKWSVYDHCLQKTQSPVQFVQLLEVDFSVGSASNSGNRSAEVLYNDTSIADPIYALVPSRKLGGF